MNLKQLSDSLGLSPTTVSRALNGYPEVSEATRKRVSDAAAEFGYSPNARAKGLATGRAHAIGHVIPISSNHEMVNPIFGDFIAGAGETYSAAGYEMLISVVEDTATEAAYRSLKNKGIVDGVIVHGPRMNDPRIPLLQSIGLPFAVHGRASGLPTDYRHLDINNRRSFRRATEFLLDLGHKRIGLINGLEFMDFAFRRRSGYLEALESQGIASDPALQCSGEMTEVIGYRFANQMLDLDTPPTAFLVSSMISALGVRRALEERGLVMGRDVSVITHDDELSYLANGDDIPIFTATRSSVRDAGRRLAKLLLEGIAHPERPPEKILLEAQIMVGSSTGPAP